MSEQNAVQQWKHGTCAGPSSTTAKTTEHVPNETSISSSSGNFFTNNGGSTSNLIISGSSSEMYNQHLQLQQQQQQTLPQHSLHHHQNFQQQMQPPFEFRLTKMENFSKLTGLDATFNKQQRLNLSEEERIAKIQQIIETGIGDHSKQQILQILDKISLLKPPERLLLYLRMPSGAPDTDPLRQPQNPLGTRSEINHTINWVRSHLEHDPKVSIPKQDVYNDYIAYCDRVDIKPLSTADFGKVMKQVFPEIRPRRLGTRGHSRYCYAAMRKATKLDPPKLPDITTNANSIDYNGMMDEDSWKVIKTWAEGLLNAQFSTLKDLAMHITKHHLNTPASNSSRLLLQKKLLQREAKEKRKYIDNNTGKKRRKKKRLNSSSYHQQQQESTLTTEGGNLITIKTENIEEQPINHHTMQQIQTQGSALQQPINLQLTDADNNNLKEIQGTNLGCDNNLVTGCVTTTKNHHQIIQNSTVPSNKVSSSNNNSNGGVIIKEELPDDYQNPDSVHQKIPSLQSTSKFTNQSVVDQPVNLMGPPEQEQISDIHHSDFSGKRSKPSSIMLQARKIRYLQAKHEALQQQQQNESGGNADGVDKDVFADNLGMPRERVISICNMDRHELDGYLNGEDNSQDQEAELLQYFQPKDGSDMNMEKHNENLKNIMMYAAGNSNNAFSSMVDNYQLENNMKMDKKMLGTRKEQDDITQLRYYLHQNLQHQSNKEMVKQIMNKPHQESSSNSSYSEMYPDGSASASLAMMSQKHLSNYATQCHGNETNATLVSGNTSVARGSRRKINLNARSSYVPSSPNTRRKNCSFVPISPNTHSGGNSMDFSPFVSPRSTPIHRKPHLHKQHSLPMSDQNIMDPMISAGVGSYNKINIISASAPPSPSLMQQRFQFAPGNSSSSVTSLHSCNEQQFNQFQSVGIQCQGGQTMSCNIDSIGERSQSVPLHCRSPAFSQSGNYPGYSSTCSSVAQTPVPSEFADFTDPSTILDIFSDTTAQSVKLEDSEIGSSLLDVNLPTANLLAHEFGVKCTSSGNSITSRSVPSTPLPAAGFKNKSGNNTDSNMNENNQELNISKIYDMSKSVPTTPIAMNMTPFRYSPEYNRDFLINGNTVEPPSSGSSNSGAINDSSMSSFYNQNLQNINVAVTTNTRDGMGIQTAPDTTTTSITDDIAELSNFGDVTESIMDSDILNNL